MSTYANYYFIKKMRLLNFCYLRGFKHGLLIANNIDKPSLYQYFSVTGDVYPCTLSVNAYEEFKKGFDDGYNLGLDDKLKYKNNEFPDDNKKS